MKRSLLGRFTLAGILLFALPISWAFPVEKPDAASASPGSHGSQASKATPPAGPGQPTKVSEDLAEGNNRFACDLYARLRAQPGNLCFSPYNLSSALGMVYAGARGKTAAEIQQTLHFPEEPAKLQKLFAAPAPVQPKDSPEFGVRVVENDGFGARVAEVLPDTLGARAGLEPEDLLLSINGAPTRTPSELAKVLHASGESLRLEVFKNRTGTIEIHTIPRAGERQKTANEKVPAHPVQLETANALWGQKNIPFLPSFVQEMKNAYHAQVATVDFRNEPQAALQEMNLWAKEKTGGKIPRLVAKDALDPMTRLVLTSAIYFEGTWKSPFPKDTQDLPFRLDASRTVPVKMMTQTGQFRVTEGDGFRALELPYAASSLVMDILLPTEMDGLAPLEKKIQVENLRAWAGQKRPQQVDLWLPKFKVSSSLDLKDPLAAMGMPLAFSPEADFSGITRTEQIALSSVLHGSFIEVDEKGTVAAAGTAAVGRIKFSPSEPKPFHADHPFLFLIRDTHSGMILFAGRVVNPKE